MCCCKSWTQFSKACPNPKGAHWILSSWLLGDPRAPELGVIAEGSLLTKVFPSMQEGLYYDAFERRTTVAQIQCVAIHAENWTLLNAYGNNTPRCSPTTSPKPPTRLKGPFSIARTNMRHPFDVFSLFFHQAIEKTVLDDAIIESLSISPPALVANTWFPPWRTLVANPILGRSEGTSICHLAEFLLKERRNTQVDVQSSPSWTPHSGRSAQHFDQDDLSTHPGRLF